MRLQQIIENPIEAFGYMERYVNNRALLRAYLKPLQHPFRPEDNCQFELPYHLVHKGDISSFAFDTTDLPIYYGRDSVRLAIHPQIIREYPDIVPDGFFSAQPTSSGRTVLIPGERPFFAKLHFPHKLGKYTKHLTLRKTAKSVVVSYLLERLRDSGRLNEKVSVMPEVAGFIRGAGTTNEVGVVYRKFPTGYIPKVSILIPLFSLWNKDIQHPEEPTLFEQVISTQHPETFITSLITKLLSAYSAIINNGIVPDPHEQNLLLEVNADLSICKLIMRDLHSFRLEKSAQSDPLLTEVYEELRVGKDLVKLINEDMDDVKTVLNRSVSYDYYLGHSVFRNLIKAWTAITGNNPADLERQIRDLAHTILPLKNFFIGPISSIKFCTDPSGEYVPDDEPIFR